MERDLIREKMIAGLKATKIIGHCDDRPIAITEKQVKRIVDLYEEGTSTVVENC